MKILATSDLHQYTNKWKLLVKACSFYRPDIVTIAGDLFPFDDKDILGHIDFFKHFKKYALEIQKMGAQLIIILGNDDNALLEKDMINGDQEGLWHYVANKVKNINGYEFIGMPYVPDYPFAYKAWCRGDSKNNLRIDSFQYGKGLIINSNNLYEPIEDLYAYYSSQPTIQEVLYKLASEVKDIKRSIWLIHAPPSGLDIDICSNRKHVGSDAIRQFILDFQPFITLHGHIHESPEYNGKIWWKKDKNTYCIQQGQMNNLLYYVIIDIRDNRIINMKHSIYGYMENII